MPNVKPLQAHQCFALHKTTDKALRYAYPFTNLRHNEGRVCHIDVNRTKGNQRTVLFLERPEHGAYHNLSTNILISM